jgi:hypothetical protein
MKAGPLTEPNFRVRPRDMRASSKFGVRFATAAAAVVAAGTLVAGQIENRTSQEFAPPPLLETIAILTIGTFIWSYLAATASAGIVHNASSVAPAAGYIGGIVFALLTPALGFVLWTQENSVFTVAMLVWVVAFPATFTFGASRWIGHKRSFERTRRE